jgi:hypothetical protein
MTRLANHTKSLLTHKRWNALVEKIVSWAQEVANRVPAIPTIATGVKVSSSECDTAKTKHINL